MKDYRGGNILDNVSSFVLLGAADHQIFWPVHEFGSEAVAAARQFGANVRTLNIRTERKHYFHSFWSDSSQLVCLFSLPVSGSYWVRTRDTRGPWGPDKVFLDRH